MQITGLDHFTIRTSDVEATAAFYTNAVGLEPGFRPPFRFPGHWLYAGGRPILHIVARTGQDAAAEAYLGLREDKPGSGRLDHVSLRGTNLAAQQEHLLAAGYVFRERIVPEVGEHQLFLEDPNGITIELIFPCSPQDRIVGTPMPSLEIGS
ncbi:MAG: VOC family protein [Candidatus Dactylopiibacterium sp.]|nr:VOC family protein [Candidatus Dactylopiibacterium sp.]